jgi:hypothetical protein
MGGCRSTLREAETPIPRDVGFPNRAASFLQSFADRRPQRPAASQRRRFPSLRRRSSAASENPLAPAPPLHQAPTAPTQQGQAGPAGTVTGQQQQRGSPRAANIGSAATQNPHHTSPRAVNVASTSVQAPAPALVSASTQTSHQASARAANDAHVAAQAPTRNAISAATQISHQASPQRNAITSSPRGRGGLVGLSSQSQTLPSFSSLVARAPQDEGPSSNPSTQEPLAIQEGHADASSSNSSTRARRATSGSVNASPSASTESASSFINPSPRLRGQHRNPSQGSAEMPSDSSSISSTSQRSILRGKSPSTSPSPRERSSRSISSASTPQREETRGYVSSTSDSSSPRQRPRPGNSFSYSTSPEVLRSQSSAMNSLWVNPFSVRPAQSFLSGSPRTEQQAIQEARSHGSSARGQGPHAPHSAVSAGTPSRQGPQSNPASRHHPITSVQQPESDRSSPGTRGPSSSPQHEAAPRRASVYVQAPHAVTPSPYSGSAAHPIIGAANGAGHALPGPPKTGKLEISPAHIKGCRCQQCAPDCYENGKLKVYHGHVWGCLCYRCAARRAGM